MRAQILLKGGPFDMHLVSYATAPGAHEFPLELRVASRILDRTEAAVYRRLDVEEAPASLMWFGAYTFVAFKETADSLVDVWV